MGLGAGYWPVHTPGHFRACSRRLILPVMSGFVVDSRTLVAVRDTLGRLQEQLVGMHTVIWHEHGTLGGQMLENELEHFCGTWHYGVAELGRQLQDLTRRLSEASAAYERIEERITHASGGSATTAAGGSPHSAPAKHHAAPASHHAAPAAHHSAAHHTAKHHSGAAASGGPHYSGGAGLAPATGGASHSGDHNHSGEKHSTHPKHPSAGSGTTVIGGGPPGGAHHGGSSHSGSGTTVIGGSGPASSSSGSGTTTVDERIHHAEARQRAELAAVLKVAER